MPPLPDDVCPRCGGSFEATGGKPISGPFQCQKCAAEDYHMPKNTKELLERELLRDLPTEFEEPNSSLILRASYNPETQDCTIVLKAGSLEKSYLYGGVPASVWSEFVMAESKGQYYNRFIRPMFGGRAL